MVPDIPGADGAEHRVDQGVQHRVGIAVTGKARGVGDMDAAKHQRARRIKPVNVIPESYARHGQQGIRNPIVVARAGSRNDWTASHGVDTMLAMSMWPRFFSGFLVTMALACVSGGCNGPVPPSSAALLHAAAAAYERGDDARASQRLGTFIARHPKSEEAGEAHYLRGLVRRRAGDGDGAEADFRRAVQLTRRDDLRGLVHLALAYGAERRNDDAMARENYLAALDALDARSAPIPHVLYGLAVLLQRQGQWQEADRRFDRLIFLFPVTPEADAASRRARARAWTIQTGSFDRHEAAQHLADRLEQAGSAGGGEPVIDPVCGPDRAI